MLMGRWYKRGKAARSPYRFFDDVLGNPRVTYRMMGASSGCSAAAWRRWASMAKLMPDGWAPDGVKPFEPPGAANAD